MKQTLIISLIISVVINVSTLVALRPGIYLSDIGVEFYSKLADDAWSVGYEEGKVIATQSATPIIYMYQIKLSHNLF